MSYNRKHSGRIHEWMIIGVVIVIIALIVYGIKANKDKHQAMLDKGCRVTALVEGKSGTTSKGDSVYIPGSTTYVCPDDVTYTLSGNP